ncbi:hypothetical protein AB0J43_00355 [Nonomuraea fuscirosea]
MVELLYRHPEDEPQLTRPGRIDVSDLTDALHLLQIVGVAHT